MLNRINDFRSQAISTKCSCPLFESKDKISLKSVRLAKRLNIRGKIYSLKNMFKGLKDF